MAMSLTGRVPPCPTQREAEFTLSPSEARRMRALQQGTPEDLTESAVQDLLGRNVSRISTFTVLHPAFSMAQQVLDRLLPR